MPPGGRRNGAITLKVKRALISVSDKTGLGDFVKGLNRLGVAIISTGGTAKMIRSLEIPVTEVSAYTGFPEMLDGRVKTLHPKIHGGLLGLRDNAEHMAQLEKEGIPAIDMVVVNLYPFEQTISQKDVRFESAIENIDIGGPSMLRSAAKNFRFVAAVSSPEQYGSVLEEMEKNNGEIGEDTLRSLAASVFAKTSGYDGLIAEYLSGKDVPLADKTVLPDRIGIDLVKMEDLRYGENPHQAGAFYGYRGHKNRALAARRQLQGKKLSFNNILDLSAAINISNEFKEPAVCIVKHNNPCGAATAKTVEEAYLAALECDRMSAFGGIIGCNKAITGPVAEIMLKEADFLECVVAPGFDDDAVKVFGTKKNLRVIEVSPAELILPGEKDFKQVPGGMLVQEIDRGGLSLKDIKVVTKRSPSEEALRSLIFAWKIVKWVKSNAIVICRGTRTVGIGAGQMARVDSVRISILKAGANSHGAVLASDAFFPKTDSITEAHKAGITAIIQPGGSISDKAVIAECDRFDIPMVFTGIRHFRH